MNWIVGNFGGSVHKIKRDNSYAWRLSTRKAYYFLKEIYPFLKYKKPQVELAIKFMDRVIHERGIRGKRLSAHELGIRDGYLEKMRSLKKEFIEYEKVDLDGAGVTTKCVNLQEQDAIV